MNLYLCLIWLTASLLLIEHSHTVSELSKEILMKLLTTISSSYIKLYKILIIYIIVMDMSNNFHLKSLSIHIS